MCKKWYNGANSNSWRIYIMERCALQYLLKWKDDPARKPLIVWGARQVGKTYLVRDLFAERYYAGRYIYLDCRVDSALCGYCSEHVDAGSIISYIEVVHNRKIDRDVLIIFDEVQECPAVVTALKYFCQDRREIPVIATGSMVRIRLKRRKRGLGSVDAEYLFPVGKINQLTLFPMTFEEFLLNRNSSMYEIVCAAYAGRSPLADELHRAALGLLYEYLIIGGMPEAVDTYFKTGSVVDARAVLTDLYSNYLSDMDLYQASPESVVRSRKIFGNIFTLLSRESKNFKSGIIERGSRTRDMNSPIDWLTEAQIVYKSALLDESVTLPLMSDNDTIFRLYLADVGMFAYQSGVNPGTFVAADSANTLSGIFYENYVADEFAAAGVPLYYWKGKNDAEFEFVAAHDGQLYPVDVKKGRGSLNSLSKFADHNAYDVAVKLSKNNFGYAPEHRILTVPLYEAFLIARDLA